MKSLKEISTILKLRDKIAKGGLYSRYDLESIEEVLPDSISSNELSVSDIPTYPNEVERERILGKMCGIVDDLEVMVNTHYLDNLSRLKGLVFKLLDIKAILESASMLTPDPVDNAEELYIKFSCGYYRLLDNDNDLTLGLCYNNKQEYSLAESNNPEISRSIMSLMLRLDRAPYQGDMNEHRSEWNGFIIKSLLNISKINYSVVTSILNNPRPLIEKIDDMVLDILAKASEARDLVTDFSNRPDNDLKELVDLDVMAKIDSTIRGCMEDKASLALLKLFAYIKFKTLK